MEDSSSEEEPEPLRPQPRHTISQQNKKSIIKIHRPETIKTTFDYNNFFC